MELQETAIFTGIPEVDTLNLRELDNETLYNICQVNLYAYDLCFNDSILKKHIREYFLNDVKNITKKIIDKARNNNVVLEPIDEDYHRLYNLIIKHGGKMIDYDADIPYNIKLMYEGISIYRSLKSNKWYIEVHAVYNLNKSVTIIFIITPPQLNAFLIDAFDGKILSDEY